MVVETLGDAFAAGWRITARCAWGKREGMKSRRECNYTRDLDLETLEGMMPPPRQRHLVRRETSIIGVRNPPAASLDVMAASASWLVDGAQPIAP
jgi:hypothetical protein